MPRRRVRARERPAPAETPIPGQTELEACRRKRRFASEREADDAAYTARMEGRTLGIYRCPLCGGWHLTRRQAGDPA